MKQDNTWHVGPPPSLGWWPASIDKINDVFRWWNGEEWSDFAGEYFTTDVVCNCANQIANCSQKSIQWKHRPATWPARSRT